MENYHILKVSHIWCNRAQNNLVKIVSERFEQFIKIPYTNEPGSFGPTLDTAIPYLESKGFTIIGKGEGKDHYYLISSTFEPLK